jgi:predicted lysophospholipase L1 biosynthesis ABC-type transport system permease subunit
LLLAHSQARRREIAIRLAIGAGRGRLIRQLLTESLVLAALGGALGVFMAMWGIDLLGSPTVIASGRNQFAQLNPFATPALDTTVMLFALAVTLGTVALFGLVPALGTSRSDLVTALKEDSRTGAGGHRRLLAGLVISDVTLAVLLLAGAGLLIKSFVLMQELRAGFVPEGVLTFWVTPPALRYRSADGPAIVERLLTSVQRVHGVSSATVNRCTPLDARCARTTIFFSDGPRDPASAPVVGRHYVSADYFRTLGIPVRAGRSLTDQDREGHPAVTVINETAAQRFWPAENYTSYLQFTHPDTMMMVKTTRAPQMLMGSLRAAIASVDQGLPLYDVQTLDERIGRALSGPRLNATVLGAFALAALVLAAIGVYGVMVYSVSSRLHEIGVRLALGADGSRVVRLMLGQGARLAGLGAAIGLAVALAATRLIQHVLFRVTPTDPIVLAGSVLIMMSAALLAAFVPARRAGAVDPVVVLRNE